MATTSFDLVVNTFSDSSTLFLASDTTKTISLTQDLKSFAMIQSKSRIYFFWIENSLIKTTTTVDGTNFTASTTVNVTDLDASIGLAGCTVKSGVDEYIALTYAKSSTEINILTFKDGSYPASTTQPISLSTISSRKVAISQNPRTEKVILTWISGNTGYYRVYDFTAPGSYNPPAGSVAIDSGFEIFYGVSCEGYNNFENSFVLPTTDNLKCYPLRSTIATHDILSPAGYAVQFPFKENNRYYAGLVSYAYGDYEFYSRELKFPAEGRWNKDTKTLHLQGPPQLNSKVKVEYEFAEVATSSCLTSIINTNGAMSAFNGQTGVIVNASNIFTVKFDTNMYPASYVSYLDNSPTSKIRLLASNSSQIDLNIVSSTTTEISFSPATDLLFNNSYSITIASDVIDWRGNQIWEPITLTFTTQNTSSNVLASEVKHITVYSDNSYSVAKIIASDGEAIGKEASNTATVYLRVEAVDPALNTIDTATVSILLNGAQIALTTLTQASATSTFFDGSFALSGPLATDSIYTFKAHPDSATSTSVVVTYPTFLPAYPASGAIGIEAKPTITIDASEELLGSSISSTTIKLLLNGIQIIATPTYVVGSKLISMTPAADLESEKTYTVSVSGLSDAYYNSQIKALSYQFTIADIAKPEVATYSPSTGELGVTIDRHVIIDFSEPLLASTVTKSTVKLTRGGIAASYSIILSGSQIRIDPDDAPDGGLRPQTTYTFEIIDTVTDPSGNSLIATFSSFTTQPYSTPPTAISSITLYKNDSLTTEWGLYEKIPASATVYVKVNGTDGATQTQDLATATLSFSWGAAAAKFSLTETASNSTGIYKGNFNLGSLPLYGFPTTLASTSIGSLTFSVDLAPANAATLTVTFPALVAGETFVNNISGQVIASNASNVRVDTPLTLTFSDELFDGGNPTSLAISSGAVSIAGTRTLSADRRKIVFQPDNPLPF
ncbi:MAG: Ig-like domain-containing protein, partial [Candidatus Riflebacteria bacterium]|nr:Ig-like domain-containing protein [Candidatus Riflebacteria bacterium]